MIDEDECGLEDKMDWQSDRQCGDEECGRWKGKDER